MNKPAAFFGCLALVLISTSAYAQLYKWVDANGKVNYTDTPPPPTAKTSEKKSLGDNTASSAADSGLPYELGQAVQNAPVTLYTTPNCPPCDEGRALLARRGVPYAEKTVSTGEDVAQLKLAGGGGQLPFLLVGRSTQQGMETTLWNNLLNAAGYPENSVLPKSYRNTAATAAAPTARTAAAKADARTGQDPAAPAASSGTLPPAVGNVPPGFRF